MRGAMIARRIVVVVVVLLRLAVVGAAPAAATTTTNQKTSTGPAVAVPVQIAVEVVERGPRRLSQ